mmetsp:Transcript_25449/g.39071  ORF Transcript_25449/g.39071 Transcript_25449/m.39071 type:complete len:403 (+) Transcript_25449:64-1272(+)
MTETEDSTKAKPQRRVIRRRRLDRKPVVDPILLKEVIQESALPKDYNFEILKSIERIVRDDVSHVALQLPEGLLMYATVLADIFKRLCPKLVSVSVLGDVTYGACCVNDIEAGALGATLLIHYGHSCLVPLNKTVLPTLYVFVEILIDVQHLVDCVCATLPEGSHVALMGTVQFRNALVDASNLLEERNRPCMIPQAKPLSPGEVLGCTAPTLTSNSLSRTMVFVADGRFHLEAAMIANPDLRALRYDPYAKTLTEEEYETTKTHSIRQSTIKAARNASCFGIVLGTLGRQGNPAILARTRSLLARNNKRCFVVLMSELSPQKLQLFDRKNVDAWVQIACPRLSIDWGHFFDKPLLTAYELHTLFDKEQEHTQIHPMDFYKNDAGPWGNNFQGNKDRQMTCL